MEGSEAPLWTQTVPMTVFYRMFIDLVRVLGGMLGPKIHKKVNTNRVRFQSVFWKGVWMD